MQRRLRRRSDALGVKRPYVAPAGRLVPPARDDRVAGAIAEVPNELMPHSRRGTAEDGTRAVNETGIVAVDRDDIAEA